MRLELPDGRVLEYTVDGPGQATPVVYHHGTPGAGLPPPALVRTAAQRGLRTVAYFRPGYAGSTPAPGRRVADAAADTAAVLDALGAGTFLTIGWSGGGPHALACAALLPDRCLGAASVAGVAPFTAAGLDWYAGMGNDNVAEFGAAVAGATALTAFLEPHVPALAAMTPDAVVAGLGDLVSDTDRADLTAELADYLALSFRTSVSAGIAGWRDDDLAFVRNWGFPFGARCPVAIWQGAQDRMVPYPHGEWLAHAWPGARAWLEPGYGHFAPAADGFDGVLDDLTRRTVER